MKRVLLVAVLAAAVSGPALAGSKVVISGNNGQVVKNGDNTTYVNKGTINGGTKPGLIINGSGNTVVNKGTIKGSTGIVLSGGSNSVVNTGTITATSNGTSGSTVVGISIGK